MTQCVVLHDAAGLASPCPDPAANGSGQQASGDAVRRAIWVLLAESLLPLCLGERLSRLPLLFSDSAMRYKLPVLVQR